MVSDRRHDVGGSWVGKKIKDGSASGQIDISERKASEFIPEHIIDGSASGQSDLSVKGGLQVCSQSM